MKLPSLGLVTCIRDEERFLADFLEYHRRLGVARAYVFLDRCSDASATIAASFPWVEVLRVQDHCQENFEYNADLQKFCCGMALDMARGDGLDWLMMLDADEFAYGRCVRPRFGPDSRQRASIADGDLRALCASVTAETEMIVLKTKEVVPFPLLDREPFWKQRFFQLRFPVHRRVFDPLAPQSARWVGWLGNDVGKSIVRLRGDVRPRGSHFWFIESEGRLREPRRLARGSFYHFHLTGAAHWREKFAKLAHEPDVWAGGDPVPFAKRVWKAASGRLGPEQAAAYLKRCVFRSERELRLRAALGQLTQETVVQDILDDEFHAPPSGQESL